MDFPIEDDQREGEGSSRQRDSRQIKVAAVLRAVYGACDDVPQRPRRTARGLPLVSAQSIITLCFHTEVKRI